MCPFPAHWCVENDVIATLNGEVPRPNRKKRSGDFSVKTVMECFYFLVVMSLILLTMRAMAPSPVTLQAVPKLSMAM